MQPIVPFLILGLALAFCTQESEQQSKRSPGTRVFENKAYNPLDLDPTNPTGGAIDGRLTSLSPEENLFRTQRNNLMPLVWGEQAAGVSMTTSYQDARNILAEPLGSAQMTEFYPEGIRIRWGIEEPKLPNMIIVDADYKGGLPLGADTILSMDNSAIDPQSDLVPTLKLVGALLEGQDPLVYDCETELTCRLDRDKDFITFDFARGGMLWDANDGVLKILYFIPPRALRPFITGPYVYGESLAGINLQTTKQEAENLLGEPDFVNGDVYFYDNFNVIFRWSPENLPLLIYGANSYRGAWQLPGDLGERFLGDQMADLALEGEKDAEGLARALHRVLENNNEDCIALGLCFVITGDDSFEIQLLRGFIGVSANSGLNLEYFGLQP